MPPSPCVIRDDLFDSLKVSLETYLSDHQDAKRQITVNSQPDYCCLTMISQKEYLYTIANQTSGGTMWLSATAGAQLPKPNS